jgi:hypothetical protein
VNAQILEKLEKIEKKLGMVRAFDFFEIIE